MYFLLLTINLSMSNGALLKLPFQPGVCSNIFSFTNHLSLLPSESLNKAGHTSSAKGKVEVVNSKSIIINFNFVVLSANVKNNWPLKC